MLVASAFITIVTVVLIRYIWKFIAYWKFFNNLPGEKRFHPLYGNFHVYPGPNEEGMALDFENAKRHRTFCRFWAGSLLPVINCFHPETVKVLLKSSAPKPRGSFLASPYDMGVPWLGEGLLIANGEKWSRNRRLLTPSFHFDILKSYMGIYNQCAMVLLKNLKTLSEKKQGFDIFSPVGMSSLDVILQCAFSHKSDCQNLKSLNVYEKSLTELQDLWVKRSLIPHLFFDFIYRLTADAKRFAQLCDVVHEVAENIIKQRKEVLEKNDNVISHSKAKVRDFLDMLLTARDEDGQGMSMLDIRNEVDTFLFEGHDTTTSGMAWALYCLAKHPEYQEKVYQEVVEVMNGKEELDWNDLGKLTFTTMCIKEALRCCCAIPFIERKLDKPLELDGHTIPTGTLVAVQIWVLHNNPHVWENPETYDPYRFTPENQAKMDPFQFIPFSAGGRNCIGQTFAMSEMRVTISQVIKNFKLSLDPDSPPARRYFAVTLKSEKGAMVTAVPRTTSS